MLWRNRYQTLGPITADSKSLRARATASGEAVLLHPALDAGDMLSELATLPAHALEHVLDIWEWSGTFYIVTDAQFGEANFTEWIERARTANSPQPAGEFTRVFQTLGNETASAPAPAPAGPGEFTRFFQASEEPRRPLAVERPPVSEFTRFLATPASTLPITPEPNGGELTKLLRRPPQRPPRPAPVIPVPPAAAPPATTPVQEGDFTRFLKASAPAPVEVKRDPPGAAVPSPVNSPGEYTRLVSVPRQPPPMIPPQKMEAPSATTPKRRAAAPLIVFSGLAALAVLLILAFAIWR